MPLDFTYSPKIPLDKSFAYRVLKGAASRLQQHLNKLTFTEAQADEGLVERLIDFGKALEGAQKTLGENEPCKLSDTAYELTRNLQPGSWWAGSLLQFGIHFREFNTKRAVHDLLNHYPRRGDDNKLWHHIKKRVAEYANAL